MNERKKIKNPITELESKCIFLSVFYYVAIFDHLGKHHHDIKPQNIRINVCLDNDKKCEGIYSMNYLMEHPENFRCVVMVPHINIK